MSANTIPSNSLVRTIFVSTKHRDIAKYPSASDFSLDLPTTLTQVHGVTIRNMKYVPEALINNNNSRFTFSANSNAYSGTIQIDHGDYNQSITDLLAAINTELNAYDVHFAINPIDNLVRFTFAGPFITDYFAIPPCKLMKLLGFPNGICLYQSNSEPSCFPSGMALYEMVACATSKYRIINDTDLIFRITDIEAILSVDRVCDRATAILLSSRSPNYIVKQVHHIYTPLLQVQHRIQRFNIKLYNSDGDLYDLNDTDASFTLEFYCQPAKNQ